MAPGKPATRAALPKSSRSRRGAELDLTVQYATRSRVVPARADFDLWIRAALRVSAEITVRVVGLREGRALNLRFHGGDYATNVLTFVLTTEPRHVCDLALCAPVVAREARQQGKPVMAHYAHLTVHGVLHLQGYTHERDADAAAMEKIEVRILRRLGYANPYAHSAHDGHAH